MSRAHQAQFRHLVHVEITAVMGIHVSEDRTDVEIRFRLLHLPDFPGKAPIFDLERGKIDAHQVCVQRFLHAFIQDALAQKAHSVAPVPFKADPRQESCLHTAGHAFDIHKDITPPAPCALIRAGGVRDHTGNKKNIPLAEGHPFPVDQHEAAVRMTETDLQAVVKMHPFGENIGYGPVTAGKYLQGQFFRQVVIPVFHHGL